MSLASMLINQKRGTTPELAFVMQRVDLKMNPFEQESLSLNHETFRRLLSARLASQCYIQESLHFSKFLILIRNHILILLLVAAPWFYCVRALQNSRQFVKFASAAFGPAFIPLLLFQSGNPWIAA